MVVCDGFVGNVMLKSMEASVELAGTVPGRDLAASGAVGCPAAQGCIPALPNPHQMRGGGWRILLGVKGTVLVGMVGPMIAPHAAIKRAHLPFNRILRATLVTQFDGPCRC